MHIYQYTYAMVIDYIRPSEDNHIDNYISSVMPELQKYQNINEGPARNSATGVEVTIKLVEDMLLSHPSWKAAPYFH